MSPQEIEEYHADLAEYDDNKPTDHKDGTGDGSTIYIDFTRAKKKSEQEDATVGIIIDHEVSHASEIDQGTVSETVEGEENRAVNETNQIRKEKNKTRIRRRIKIREKYND